jgi:hypothetical protein
VQKQNTIRSRCSRNKRIKKFFDQKWDTSLPQSKTEERPIQLQRMTQRQMHYLR